MTENKTIDPSAKAMPKVVSFQEITGMEVEVITLQEIFSFEQAGVDNEGRVLVLAGGRSKHPAREVRIFDAHGEPLPGFTLPEPSHCLYVDSRGFLYTRANAGVTLKKYRLAFR